MKKLNYKNVLNHKSLTKNKGITLIALIVTIIIVLILASVSIVVLSNTGIIKKSKFVGETYQNKINEEEKAMQNYASTMNEYTIADNGRDTYSGIIYDTLFEGDASTIGTTYNLSKSINNYKFIIVYAKDKNNEHDDSLIIDKSNYQIGNNSGEIHTVFSQVNDSWYWFLAFYFPSENQFCISQSHKGNYTDGEIYLIKGISF